MKKFDILKRGRRKNIAVVFWGLIILTVIGVRFALYTTDSEGFGETKGLNNGTKLAVFVEGVKQENFPTKGSGYAFESVTCENGSTGTWDSSNWQLDMAVKGPDECIVSFREATAADYVMGLLSTNPTTMNNDDPDGNVRYMGANPNNYVTFNDESWRIIGVFDVASSEGSVTEKRVKLIRTDGIGEYSWDSSASGINNGYGVNEWSQADLMTVLNSGAYYNRTSGTCYNADNNGTIACDFSSAGLTSDAKTLISDTYWHTGTISQNWKSVYSTIMTEDFYNGERSTNNGKSCSSVTYCTDTVTRTTGWVGEVGLMYPSDYGYATSGGATTNRATCLSTALNGWNGTGVSDCKNNSWLFNSSSYQWTMTPVPDSSNANLVFRVHTAGYVSDYHAISPWLVRPVVYLSADVKITGGDGSSASPYILGL